MTQTEQDACEKKVPNHPLDGLVLPSGFRFSGAACGIKPSGKQDISLIVTDRPAVAAGTYTQNQIVAAPVVLCRQRTPSQTLRAVITNSGNANACTGDVGDRDAAAMCKQVAEQIGCPEKDVLVMSTGVIGQPLPMDRVQQGIAEAIDKLDATEDSFLASADGILTTDKSRKIACRKIELNGQTYSIAAMAKGAGMIAPNMATMLAVILTDAPIAQEDANNILPNAVQRSFNRVSVDGHTSTNDTCLLLSSGEGESLQGDSLATASEQICDLSIELAKQLVGDGEGASHIISIRVTGAEDTASAEVIAKTVAASPLVKTAITGGDPNWGRIVSAAGYAEAKITPSKTSLKICEQTIYANGSPVEFDAAELSSKMKQAEEVLIELVVGDGNGEAEYWASDLTTDYVRFNSEYTT